MALYRALANQKVSSQDMMKAAEEQPENERAIKIRITIIDENATNHEAPPHRIVPLVPCPSRETHLLGQAEQLR